MKRLILILAVLAIAAPASAQRAFRLTNPATWLNINQQVISSECGWLIGKPFALDGRQTQLALQVFTGNTADPAFLASFDSSDSRSIENDGDAGLILKLRGGTYTAVEREDGFRLYVVGNRSADGWDILERIKHPKTCGVNRKQLRSTGAGFFGTYSYLIAGVTLAGQQDLFDAYFAGRPDEVAKLLARAQEVQAASARFLQLEQSAPVTEEVALAPGCDFETLLDLVNSIQVQASNLDDPTRAQILTIQTLAAEAQRHAGLCQ